MITFTLNPWTIALTLVYGMRVAPGHQIFRTLRDDASAGDDSTPHSWEP